MKIERVEVQGFRSFKDIETFDFSDAVGLVNLTGVNEDEPALGANGAGKSSLWEAILWCLYGSTSTGLKGPEVATWGQGRGIYTLAVIGGHKVVRSWGANKLQIDGEDATQEQVDEVVGLTREQFLFCSYMAQHTDAFLDLGPTAKTDMLASILDLDKWLDYSAAASARVKTLDKSLTAVEVTIGETTSAIDTLEQTDYASMHQDWVQKKRETMVGLVLVIDAKRTDIERLEVDLPKLQTRYEEASAQDQQAVSAKDESSDSIKEAERDERALVRRHDELDAAHRAGKCSQCGQKLPHSHTKEIDKVHAQIKKLRERLKAEREKHIELKEQANETGGRAVSLSAKLADMRSAHSAAVRDVRAFEAEHEKHKRSRSPYEGLIADKAQRVQELLSKHAQLNKERAQVEALREATVHWVQAFKDVRLFLVAEALLQLEVEVNSALAQLGLHDWLIRFAPDSETKAGAIKRGFSVTVMSPNNERPVPWQVWSGGEAQRLRVAASMGLSNLIAAYTGYLPFVEVWDEPTNGMSREGIEDLLTAMSQRAQSTGRQVWIIDHRALDAGVFQQTVTAVKQDGTTTLRKVEHGQGE